ncbi:MAG: ComEC/Rec2 family competence protein [Anaerolineae bacterium]
MTLMYLILAWLAGLALASAVALPWPFWLACAALGVIAALLGREDRRWRLGGALVVVAALGALRLTLATPSTSALQPHLGQTVTLTGTVAEAPDVRAKRSELVLAVESLKAAGEDQPLRASVLLRLPREMPYRYGDRLRVSGRLRAPAAGPGFDYRAYLQRRGITGLMERPEVEYLGEGSRDAVRALLNTLGDRSESLVNVLWPPSEAPLLAGILLGRERAIPEQLLEAFNATGTRHIIAISGFNITLLAGWLAAVLVTFLNRRVAAPLVMASLLLYAALVGADPPVLRAAIMGCFCLLAFLAGRPADARIGLALSAWLMTLLQPWALWETSFQLSFASTLGLITLEPRLEGWIAGWGKKRIEGTEGEGPFPSFPVVPSIPSVPSAPPVPSVASPALPPWLREALLVSLAAQAATLPITLASFGRLSLVAPLANLLILPAQAPLMQLGLLAVVAAWLWRPLGQALAWLAWPFAAYTIEVARRLGALPWTSVDIGRVEAWLPWLLYAVGAFLLWARANRERRRAVWQAVTGQLGAKAAILGLAALAATLWIGALRLPDGKLHVTFLDVGQGDAILIQTPEGHRLLIDGGPDPTVLPAAIARRLPPWDRRLDLVALTHPDDDHLAGLLPILRSYRISLLLDTHLPRESPNGAAWNDILAPWQQANGTRNTQHVPQVLYPERGTTLDLGSSVRLQVLHPGPELLQTSAARDNNNSLVLRLSYGRASFLFTGDLETEAEMYLLRQQDLPLRATVLKVAHHGAKTATSKAFLEAVAPQVAVISVGAGNRFGHPAPEVLARLEEAGAQVWRTDSNGEVEVVTDGEQVWVRTAP